MRPNRLFVKYLGGFTVVEDAADVSARGAHESFVSLRVDKVDAAQALATEMLTEANTVLEAIVVGVLPTAGAVPYDDYAVGDTVQAPTSAGGEGAQRVVGLTVTETDDGEVRYSPELNAPLPIDEDETAALLRRLGDNYGGQPRAAAGGVHAGVTNERAAPVSFKPLALEKVVQSSDGGETGGGGGGSGALYDPIRWGGIGVPLTNHILAAGIAIQSGTIETLYASWLLESANDLLCELYVNGTDTGEQITLIGGIAGPTFNSTSITPVAVSAGDQIAFHLSSSDASDCRNVSMVAIVTL